MNRGPDIYIRTKRRRVGKAPPKPRAREKRELEQLRKRGEYRKQYEKKRA